jgi:hypothetical protein
MRIGASELGRCRLQRLGTQQRPSGVLVALRGREQPGGVMVQQAATTERGRLPVRNFQPRNQLAPRIQ